MAAGGQVRGGAKALARQAAAVERHRMSFQGQPQGLIIRNDVFGSGQGGQADFGVGALGRGLGVIENR